MADRVVEVLSSSCQAAAMAFEKYAHAKHNYIERMPWEVSAAKSIGLTMDQFRFIVALMVSLPIGFGLSYLKSSTARHLYAAFTGTVLVYYPFGAGIIMAFPPAVLTYLMMSLAPRQAGVLSWAVNFPFLIALHVRNASGEKWNAGHMDFTGGVMVLVLKLLSSAVCRADSFRAKREALSEYQQQHALPHMPGPLAWASYLFCCGNLLAGPYFEYSEYEDFIHLRGAWSPSSPHPMMGRVRRGLLSTTEALACICIHMVLGEWRASLLLSHWYMAQPFIIRLCCLVVVGCNAQLRYFFTWKVAEASLTLAGFNWLGCDEQGKPRWGRATNVRILGIWTADSARTVTQHWNIATGKFLRRYVYERLVRPGHRPGFSQLLATQMVSSVWHGLYAGYFLFFAGSALWVYTAQVLYRAETHLSPRVRHSLILRVAKAVYTNVALCYIASSFLLLDLRHSLQVYASVHYVIHVLWAVLCLLGFVVKRKHTPKATSHFHGNGKPPSKGSTCANGNAHTSGNGSAFTNGAVHASATVR